MSWRKVDRHNPKQPPKPGEFVWTTRDGERWPVSQMRDSHLTNTIYFLRRRCVALYVQMDMMYLSANVGMMGDMAQIAFDEEHQRFCELTPVTFVREHHLAYQELTKEAARRELVIDAERGWPDEKQASEQAFAMSMRMALKSMELSNAIDSVHGDGQKPKT